MGVAEIILASIFTGGTLYSTFKGQHEEKQWQKKQEEELERQRQEAEDAKKKIQDIEKERARRLTERGSTLPDTILSSGTFSGLKTPPALHKQKLLGA